jgi:hypothetical protein
MPKLKVEGVGTVDVPAGKRLVLALEERMATTCDQPRPICPEA